MKSNLVNSPTIAESGPRRGGKADPGDYKRTCDAAAPAISRASPKTRDSSIILVGASFRNSSLAFREEFAKILSRDSGKIRRMLGVREYAELITCNRVEILLATEAPKVAERFFLSWFRGAAEAAPFPLYLYNDTDAIAHFFRVASGLDSMVTGEEQILSQVKDAGSRARTLGHSRASLSALFDASVNVGRRVRRVLDLSGPSQSPNQSVGALAIRFALGTLSRTPRNVLLIGTGKTMRLAANQLDGAAVHVATRRSLLSSFPGAKLVAHKDLAKVAEKCDLIISATKNDGYLLKKGDLSEGKRRVILDLGFPRNIDPALREGSNEVYNLDDLARDLASKASSPAFESMPAEELVSDEAERFSRWLLASKQSATLAHVYQWAETLRSEETGMVLRRLPGLSERERKVVQAMSKRLVSKLLGPPTRFAKSHSPELPQDQRLDIVQRIFEQGEPQ